MAAKASSADLAGTMLQLVSGYWVAQGIRAASILGIADRLKDGPKHFEDLAKAAEAHPSSLYRLLRALASVGIFAETAEKGVFEMTPLAQLLQSDSEGSLRDLAIFNGNEELYRSWGNIMHTMTTGSTAMSHTFGMEGFDYFQANPERAKYFDRAMTSYSAVETPAILAAYDFPGISTLMDVGGGQGFLLASVLKAHPQMKGILFDLPPVIEQAKDLVEPVADRCQLAGGSFFDPLPSGADAIVMKSILHDWSPEKQREILKQCYAALPPQGKLLVVERVVPEGNAPHPSKWMDVHMMVCLPGAMEHTASEYETILKAEGFALQRIIPVAGSDMSVVEVVKV